MDTRAPDIVPSTAPFDESSTAWNYRHAASTCCNGAEGSLVARMDSSFSQKGLPFLPDSAEVLWSRFQRVELESLFFLRGCLAEIDCKSSEGRKRNASNNTAIAAGSQ